MPAILKSTQTAYYRPAIPVTLALIAGIILGEGLPGLAALALITTLAAVGGLGLCLWGQRRARWLPLLACLGAGYLAMVPWVSPAHGPDQLVHYLDSGYWRIQGSVIDQPTTRFERTQLTLEVQTLSRESVVHPVRGRIRLTVVGDAVLSPGDRLTFPARIQPFHNFKNPGAFDYRRHMAFKGICGRAWVQAPKIQINGSRSTARVSRLVHGARQELTRMIDAADRQPAGEPQAVLKALVLGDRSGIDDGLRERFNRAGVGHLLAISGLHVGIVATVAFVFWRWVLSFFTPLLWRGWIGPWAAAATVLPVLAYGVLAGMSPSTQRAEMMVAVFLLGLILGRTHDSLNTLAVAALVIVTLFPPALFSISFQLSFAAVAAILYGYQKIGPAREDAGSTLKKIGSQLLGLVLVSALAIAGTTPVVLYHFNQTSVVGIVANLFLVPLVGFVVVPLGLTAAFAALVFEPAAALGFWLSLKILHLALMGVECFAGLSFAAIRTVTPSMLEILLYYVIGWSLLNLRKTVVARWVLAAALVGAVADGFYWSHQRFWHRDFRVMAIDVGQGASTLMQLPGGAVVLLDGGGFSDNRLFDVGQRVVAPVLWRKKIATVDILILSHPHADHLNGLIYIARHFRVRELWVNGDVHASRGYQELMTVCREKAIFVRRVHADSALSAMGAVTIAVLHPTAELFSRSAVGDRPQGNNGSLVIQAGFGETAFLLTGDIELRAETELVQRSSRELASTVLFAPHHGSRSSNSPGLVAAVNPEAVIISAGAGNRFDLPHAEVVDRYLEAGCQVFNTATHGAISMRSDGKAVRVRPFVK